MQEFLSCSFSNYILFNIFTSCWLALELLNLPVKDGYDDRFILFLKQSLVQVSAWCTGEYGELLFKEIDEEEPINVSLDILFYSEVQYLKGDQRYWYFDLLCHLHVPDQCSLVAWIQFTSMKGNSNSPGVYFEFWWTISLVRDYHQLLSERPFEQLSNTEPLSVWKLNNFNVLSQRRRPGIVCIEQ